MNFLFQSKATPSAEASTMDATERANSSTCSSTDRTNGILIVSGGNQLIDSETSALGMENNKEASLSYNTTKFSAERSNVGFNANNAQAATVKTEAKTATDVIPTDQFELDDDSQLIVPGMSNSNLTVPSNVGFSILSGLELSEDKDINPQNGQEILTTAQRKAATKDSATSNLMASCDTHTAEAFMNVGNLLLDPAKESRLVIDNNGAFPTGTDKLGADLVEQECSKQKWFAHFIPNFSKSCSVTKDDARDMPNPSTCNIKTVVESPSKQRVDVISSTNSKSQVNTPSLRSLARRKKLPLIVLSAALATLAITYGFTVSNFEVVLRPEDDMRNSSFVELATVREDESASAPLVIETSSNTYIPEHGGCNIDVEEDRESFSDSSRSYFWQSAFLFLIGMTGIVPAPFGARATPSLKKKKRGSYRRLPRDIDLTKYDELRIIDLKPMLKARSLKVSGKKASLIQRLVGAYEKELWELTVISLRANLKKKGLKQSGLKHELVARLIEAGL